MDRVPITYTVYSNGYSTAYSILLTLQPPGIKNSITGFIPMTLYLALLSPDMTCSNGSVTKREEAMFFFVP